MSYFESAASLFVGLIFFFELEILLAVKLTVFLPGDSKNREGDANVGINCVIESFVVCSVIELHPVTSCTCG